MESQTSDTSDTSDQRPQAKLLELASASPNPRENGPFDPKRHDFFFRDSSGEMANKHCSGFSTKKKEPFLEEKKTQIVVPTAMVWKLLCGALSRISTGPELRDALLQRLRARGGPERFGTRLMWLVVSNVDVFDVELLNISRNEFIIIFLRLQTVKQEGCFRVLIFQLWDQLSRCWFDPEQPSSFIGKSRIHNTVLLASDIIEL